MTISQKELGKRLRAAREAQDLTQDDVAKHLSVSRPTVAQMELGNRTISGLELDRLARLYGRDIHSFFAEKFREEDVLVSLFRAEPEVTLEEETRTALRDCMTLAREVTSLESFLGLDRTASAPTYPLVSPRTKWDAIQQGERIADEERRRLDLGAAPVPDLIELLETQGVRTALVRLPEKISGLTLRQEGIGVFVAANEAHRSPRLRFSYAHEYGHVLMDRDRLATISLATRNQDLREVRANAFAAAFLLPAAGVRQFLEGLGKGHPSRTEVEVFDGERGLHAEGREAPGSQRIRLYDVAALAHHFRVSRLAALFRLHNLRFLSEEEREALRAQDEGGAGKKIDTFLGFKEQGREMQRERFRQHFLHLALEAFRRKEITRGKLLELARLVGIEEEPLADLLERAGLAEDEGGAAPLLPQGARGR